MPILHNIAQLATCPPDAPQHDAGLIPNAALAWRGDIVEWVGPRAELPDRYQGEPTVDCGRKLVVPGLIDCHTHACFGGWRADEFSRRILGASYSEIAQSGGGISKTVTATRAATEGELLSRLMGRLDEMSRLGVTTIECKSGYGLDEATEIKMLVVIREAGFRHALDVIPTFLGAHTVPASHRSDRGAYVDLLCRELIPRVAAQGLARFCDVFVDGSAFSVAEAEAILGAAIDHGLVPKVHADQLSDDGGAALAARMGAISAEHLEYASRSGMEALAASRDGRGTVAVSLPIASLYLGEPYLPARRFMEAGVAVAVATDFNPGSAPSCHLPLAMTLACTGQRMTPCEALVGATSVAARSLDEADRIGSLLPGYQADLAIIDAPDVDHWLYHFRANACSRVMKAGRWIDLG